MNKFIIFLILLTIGCSQQKEQLKEKQESLSPENKAVVVSDKAIGIENLSTNSDLAKIVQFHIYYDGALCGYANCLALFEDKTLTKLKSMQIVTIVNSKGLIDSLTLTDEGCEFDLKVHIQKDYHLYKFFYECCKNDPHIAVYSFSEASIEALQDKKSGIRVVKEQGKQFLPIRFVDN